MSRSLAQNSSNLHHFKTHIQQLSIMTNWIEFAISVLKFLKMGKFCPFYQPLIFFLPFVKSRAITGVEQTLCNYPDLPNPS